MPTVLPFLRGPFSQFHPCRFTVDGRDYICAEQFMHAEKALLFGDKAMAERIMRSDSPHEHKLMGGRVSGFEQALWDERKVPIVTEGNRAKFGQNAGLRRRLLDTGEA
ncbi:MAG TPA: NADAR family protein, partial [Hyphomonadaceae bacterium]|nr:NADAR family protein [Hyphomonadaceae bacterium]